MVRLQSTNDLPSNRLGSKRYLKRVWDRRPTSPSGIDASRLATAARFIWQLRHILTDKQHVVLSHLNKTFGDRFRIQIGFRSAVILSDPVAIQQVLEMGSESMSAGAGRKRLVGMFPAHSVLYAEGADHKRMRHHVAIAFGKATKSYDLEKHLRDLVKQIQETKTEDPYELIRDKFIELAADFVLGDADAKVCEAARRVLSQFGEIHTAAIVVPWLRKTRHFGQGLRNYQIAQQALLDLVEQRIQTPNGVKANCFLSTLKLQQFDGNLNASEVRDNAAFFFLVIMRTMITLFENVAQTLAVESAWQDRLRRLAPNDACRKNGSKNETGWHRAVIKETMRLIPLAPMFVRLAKADSNVDGFQIRKGEYVIVSPEIAHGRESVFPNPHVFDPTRFIGRHNYGYSFIPFGGGRHHCIGSGWLMDTMATVLRRLLPHLEFQSDRPHARAEEFSLHAVFLLARRRNFSIQRIEQDSAKHNKFAFQPTRLNDSTLRVDWRTKNA
jgi:cytochrome P450